MTLRDIELRLHRRGTDHFIEMDPTPITLIPSNEILEFGTIVLVDQPARESRNYKLIWSGSDGIVSTIDGSTRRFDFVIVGHYDSVIAVGDHWKIGDVEYQITYVYPTNGYETKAGGVAHGQPS